MVLTNTKSSSEQSMKTDMKQTNSLPAMKTYSTSKEAIKKRKQRAKKKKKAKKMMKLVPIETEFDAVKKIVRS